MNKLYGLVLCGGQSSRMGEDKSLLNYHGKPQRYFLYDLLKPWCEKVFISCNSNQAQSVLSSYEKIVDEKKYSGTGPMGALLSAFENYPDASFLVAGCDYPFIRNDHVKKLIDVRIGLDDAICYRHKDSGIIEPLFAIYESDSRKILQENFKEKRYSLQHFLNEANTCLIVPDDLDFLESIDSVKDYFRIKEILSAKLN